MRSSQSALCVWWWLKGPGGRTGWEKVCVMEGSGEERKINIHIVFFPGLTVVPDSFATNHLDDTCILQTAALLKNAFKC